MLTARLLGQAARAGLANAIVVRLNQVERLAATPTSNQAGRQQTAQRRLELACEPGDILQEPLGDGHWCECNQLEQRALEIGKLGDPALDQVGGG